MDERQSIQPARASRSLWVLLAVCAGALLIIVVTMAGDLREGALQTAHATAPAACSMSARDIQSLPLSLQPAMKDDCATSGAPAR